MYNWHTTQGLLILLISAALVEDIVICQQVLLFKLVTATGMYQKGQYSKSLYKIWLDIQVIPKMAVATNCKQFYQQSYSTYSKIQISQSKKSTCYVFKMSQHKHNLCHYTESKRTN